MIETNHIQTSNLIYCEKLRKIVTLDRKHFSENCLTCPYFAGTAQGQGIECYYYDGTNEGISFNEQVDRLKERMSTKSEIEILTIALGRKKVEPVAYDLELLNKELMS